MPNPVINRRMVSPRSEFDPALCNTFVGATYGGDTFDCYPDDKEVNKLPMAGTYFSGKWIDATMFAGEVSRDTVDEYPSGAIVNGLSGGSGFSAPFVDRNLGVYDDTTHPPLAYGLTGQTYCLISGGGATADPTEFTVAAWVNKNDSVLRGVFVRTEAAGPNVSYSHTLYADTVLRGMVNDGGIRTAVGTTVLTPGVWYHVAMTCKNASVIRLYVNGAAEGTTPAVGTAWTGGDRWRVASFSAIYSVWVGAMADATIWNKELTAAEIATIAAGSIGTPLSVQPGSLVLNFPMQDVGYGDTAVNWTESVGGLTLFSTCAVIGVGGPG